MSVDRFLQYLAEDRHSVQYYMTMSVSHFCVLCKEKGEFPYFSNRHSEADGFRVNLLQTIAIVPEIVFCVHIFVV